VFPNYYAKDNPVFFSPFPCPFSSDLFLGIDRQQASFVLFFKFIFQLKTHQNAIFYFFSISILKS
jgi:hypothetical protein